MTITRKRPSPLLKEPGRHEFDVGAGPYAATIVLNVPEPNERPKINPSIVMYVDEATWDQESFQDYEDDLLESVGKNLNIAVSWGEGDWGRGTDGTKSRHITFRQK